MLNRTLKNQLNEDAKAKFPACSRKVIDKVEIRFGNWNDQQERSADKSISTYLYARSRRDSVYGYVLNPDDGYLQEVEFVDAAFMVMPTKEARYTPEQMCFLKLFNDVLEPALNPFGGTQPAFEILQKPIIRFVDSDGKADSILSFELDEEYQWTDPFFVSHGFEKTQTRHVSFLSKSQSVHHLAKGSYLILSKQPEENSPGRRQVWFQNYAAHDAKADDTRDTKKIADSRTWICEEDTLKRVLTKLSSCEEAMKELLPNESVADLKVSVGYVGSGFNRYNPTNNLELYPRIDDDEIDDNSDDDEQRSQGRSGKKYSDITLSDHVYFPEKFNRDVCQNNNKSFVTRDHIAVFYRLLSKRCKTKYTTKYSLVRQQKTGNCVEHNFNHVFHYSLDGHSFRLMRIYLMGMSYNFFLIQLLNDSRKWSSSFGETKTSLSSMLDSDTALAQLHFDQNVSDESFSPNDIVVNGVPKSIIFDRSNADWYSDLSGSPDDLQQKRRKLIRESFLKWRRQVVKLHRETCTTDGKYYDREGNGRQMEDTNCVLTLGAWQEIAMALPPGIPLQCRSCRTWVLESITSANIPMSP